MTFAQIQNGTPVAISQTIQSGDLTIPLETLSHWTDDQRAAVGVYTITDDAIPTGKVQIGSTLEKVGSVVQRHFTTADAPPPPVPFQVSAAQAKVALFNAGLLDSASAAVAAAYKPIQIYWDSSPTFERVHPYVQGIGALLSLTDAQQDALFTAAAAL